MDAAEFLKHREGETEFEYHKRILSAKLIDKTLDLDYSTLAPYLYGKEYAPDVARRMAYGSLKTLSLIDDDSKKSVNETVLMTELEAKNIELKKERQKLFDARNAFNKLIRKRARQEELNEILKDAINRGDLPRLDPVDRSRYSMYDDEDDDTDLLVSLNDIHYGIEIDNKWNQYSPEICREMFSSYLRRVVTIAGLHNSRDCYVYNCGDSISGNIHLTTQLANTENAVDQVKGVSELISEFLAELSKYFEKVVYVSVSGNHSRLNTKDDSPLDERLDDLIEWYCVARLQDFENIYIDLEDRIDPTMFAIDIRGKTYCGVHGDYEPSESHIASLQTFVEKPLYAVLLGHRHHNKTDAVQGVKTIMAGSFLGIDNYCIQKRIYGHQEQMVCVCDESGILCHYDIPLGGSADV